MSNLSVVDGLRNREPLFSSTGVKIRVLTDKEYDLLLDVVEALKKSEATLRAMGMPVVLHEALAALESAQGAERKQLPPARTRWPDARWPDADERFRERAQGAERPEPGEGA